MRADSAVNGAFYRANAMTTALCLYCPSPFNEVTLSFGSSGLPHTSVSKIGYDHNAAIAQVHPCVAPETRSSFVVVVATLFKVKYM